MDIVTQAVLGGAVGLSAGGRKLGRRALGWGIIGGIIPDLDIFFTHLAGPLGEYLIHRGPTHGLFTGVFLGLLVGYLLWRLYDGARPRMRLVWIRVMVLAIVTHPLLDIFTSYGTQLLWPFSSMRIASSGVSIVDPLYTIPLIITLCYGWITRASHRAIGINTIMLGLTTAYLFLGLGVSRVALHQVTSQVKIPPNSRVTIHKTLGQPFLHRVLIDHEKSLKIAHISVLHPQKIHTQTYIKPTLSCQNALASNPDVRVFHWFNDGQFIVHEPTPGTFVFTDTRYGIPGTKAHLGIFGMKIILDPRTCRPQGTAQRISQTQRVNIVHTLNLIYKWSLFGAEETDTP